MAKILHFMGTEAAAQAALTFLGRNNPDHHFNYSGFEVVSDGEHDHNVEEYVIVVQDFPDLAVSIMRIVGFMFSSFCWELTSETGEREDGDFNSNAVDIKTVMRWHLRQGISLPTLLLRYELALEDARSIRFPRPALYTSLAVAVGQLAKLHDGEVTLMKAELVAHAHTMARWPNGTDEIYEARRIVFLALADAIGQYINEHGRG